MASTYTTNGGIEKIGTGDQAGTWGTTTNLNLDIIDRLINGVGTVTISGTTDIPEDVEYDQIQVNILQRLGSNNERELKPWTIAGGDLGGRERFTTGCQEWTQLVVAPTES